MSLEALERGSGADRPRPGAKPSEYADYDKPAGGDSEPAVRGPVTPAGRMPHVSHRRGGRKRGPGRQQAIRSTITILLIIPLLSLVALWGYSASEALGPALSERATTTVNGDLGGPLEELLNEVGTEQSDTYVWLSGYSASSRIAMGADRSKTDADISAFEGGADKAAGSETPAEKRLQAALLARVNGLASLRKEVDDGSVTPLTAFTDYGDIVGAINPFVSALNNPADNIELYNEGQGAASLGLAISDINEESALVNGARVSGGAMPAAELRLFTQIVDNQRLLESEGTEAVDWELNPDPFGSIFRSATFSQFQGLENDITSASPGRALPVDFTTWETDAGKVIREFIPPGGTAREDVINGDAQNANSILNQLILVGGLGLLAVILSSVLLLGFGNRIRRELTDLGRAARALAEERLPNVVERLRAGQDVDVDAEAPPLNLDTRTREVTDTATAFSEVRRTAIEAAVEQATLRNGVSLVFRSLARRNQSLLQRQLRMLDEMEHSTEDPGALEQLFKIDHLTTRMRRQAEGLIILSGAAPGRTWRQPVPVIEVLRGAIGEIEDYTRVEIASEASEFMQGAAVADVTHLLAELIENAVLYSPPFCRVQVRSSRVSNGYAIEVEDRGLGIPEATLRVLNERLAMPPEFDLADSDQLGLFVVSRLAARHQIRVTLRPSGYGGTLAIVLLPRALVVAEEEPTFIAAQTVSAEAGRGLGGTGGGQAPPSDSSGEAQAGGSWDLPKRQPGGNMAPQLHAGRQSVPREPVAERSPEQARALLSSIRKGWMSGLGDGGDTGDTGGSGSAGGSRGYGQGG